jgi:hypothetical protein
MAESQGFGKGKLQVGGRHEVAHGDGIVIDNAHYKGTLTVVVLSARDLRAMNNFGHAGSSACPFCVSHVVFVVCLFFKIALLT